MNSTTNRTRPLASLAIRRRLVLIGVLGLVTILVSQFLGSSGVNEAVWKPLSAGGIIILVFGWAGLVIPGYLGLPRIDQPNLDERQRAVMTNAYASAYRVVAVGLMSTCAYLMLMDIFAGLPRLSSLGDNSIMVVSLIWIVIGLPAAILAWNEPDYAD